jgi:hypothetical protein
VARKSDREYAVKTEDERRASGAEQRHELPPEKRRRQRR